MLDDFKKQQALFYYSLKVSLGVCLLMVVVHLIFSFAPIPKYNWSIYPRDVSQWYGIVTGQFIHSSWGHLFSNIAPLLVTIVVLFFFYHSISWAVFIMIILLTGFSVFVLGRNLSHIGASGMVYGLISFIFFSGIFRRNKKSIALAAIMVLMYGGYTAGFLPNQPGVSWESHILGALSGLWVSFIFKNYAEIDEKEQRQQRPQQPLAKEYYLPRDTFEKTLAQRQEEANEARRYEEQGLSD